MGGGELFGNVIWGNKTITLLTWRKTLLTRPFESFNLRHTESSAGTTVPHRPWIRQTRYLLYSRCLGRRQGGSHLWLSSMARLVRQKHPGDAWTGPLILGVGAHARPARPKCMFSFTEEKRKKRRKKNPEKTTEKTMSDLKLADVCSVCSLLKFCSF